MLVAIEFFKYENGGIYLVLNIGYVSHETNTDVHMYTWKIYSRWSALLGVQVGTEILYGKYIGFYTIATTEEKCENCSWMTIDRVVLLELQWHEHSTVCLASNTCKCELESLLTLCSSNSWRNYWMSFLQLVLSLDKVKDGFNSILPIVSLWSISQHLEFQPVFRNICSHF